MGHQKAMEKKMGKDRRRGKQSYDKDAFKKVQEQEDMALKNFFERSTLPRQQF